VCIDTAGTMVPAMRSGTMVPAMTIHAGCAMGQGTVFFVGEWRREPLG